jgi:hypothetical protein
MSVDYAEWLESAKGELVRLQCRKDALQQERANLDAQERDINAKIDAMAQTMSALAPLVPEANANLSLAGYLSSIGKTMVEMSMRERIRAILHANAEREFSAVQIRNELELLNFGLESYSNALSTIYTVLRRLVAAGQAWERASPEGRKFQAKLPGGIPIPSLPLLTAGFQEAVAQSPKESVAESLARQMLNAKNEEVRKSSAVKSRNPPVR